jgi:hypothetical protein
LHRTLNAALLAAAADLVVVATPSPSFAQSHDSSPTSREPSLSKGEEGSTPEVWVHVEASKGVRLLQEPMVGEPWRTACFAPCDRPLPITGRYQVVGGGFRPSTVFTLDAPSGTEETLVVDDPSRTLSTVGVVGLVSGPIVTAVGLFVTLSLLGGDGPNPPVLYTGFAVMGAGLVALVGGIVLVTSSKGDTKVDQIYEGHRTRMISSGASSRTPAWSAAEPKNLPPVMGLPILSGRF